MSLFDRDRVFVSDRVANALEERRPVVALESTVITHGLPYPRNLELASELERTVREGGAEPATVGVDGGRLVVGLDSKQIERFADAARGGPGGGTTGGKNDGSAAGGVDKASLWNLGALAAQRRTAGTTVAATLHAAALTGIETFATGGIGGVHPRDPQAPDARTSALRDESADLSALARTPVVTVCAGPKSILDVPATLERLESLGVPVIGYRSSELAGFHSASAGLPVPVRADDPGEIAAVFRAHRALGLRGGVLVSQPVEDGIDPERLERWLAAAEADARAAGLRGKATTPFLLQRLAELSAGATVEVNLRLLKHNAALAAAVAAALLRDAGPGGAAPRAPREPAGIQS